MTARQDHESTGWLSVAVAEELDEAQRAEFLRLVAAYDATQAGRRFGDAADYASQDRAAWAAAFEYVTGGLDVIARGRAYREAQDAAYAGAVIAALAGVSEVQAAKDATITRVTLRRLLGK